VVAIGTQAVTVYDAATGRPLGPTAGNGPAGGAIALGDVNGRLAVAYETFGTLGSSTVDIWDVGTGTRLGTGREFTTGAGHSVYGLDVRSLAIGTVDGQPLVVAGTQWGEVWVWNPMAPGQARDYRPHTGTVGAVALATLYRRPVILTGDEGGLVRVWSPAGTLLTALDVGAAVNALAVLPGERVAVGCVSGLLLLHLAELPAH
jgi:WD40 repeat protein